MPVKWCIRQFSFIEDGRSVQTFDKFISIVVFFNLIENVVDSLSFLSGLC